MELFCFTFFSYLCSQILVIKALAKDANGTLRKDKNIVVVVAVTLFVVAISIK